MKKKLLVLAMTGLMTASVLTACGGKETTATTAAETTTVAETTTEAETTEAETTEAAAAAADAAIEKFDEYLTWTGKEWTAANDDDKLNAAIVYSVYTTEALSGEEFDAETRALTVSEMRAAEDIQNVVTQLEAALPKFDKSIKDFADTGVEQINTMIEAEADAAAGAAGAEVEAEAATE